VELNGRELSWDGCVNVRDLGGLGQIRPGALVRMEQPRRLTEAGWACVVFHCAGGKDRTGLLALVLLTLGSAAADEIIADYLLTYDRMKQRYDEIGVPNQLTTVIELLASRDTTIEASLTSTIASLAMPDFFLDNGMSDDELAALLARLTQ
jgi:protein-tyrosine phosphatase